MGAELLSEPPTRSVSYVHLSSGDHRSHRCGRQGDQQSKRANRLAKYAVVVAARLVVFSVLSPIGAAAHQDYVETITAMATSMSDEGYAEAVRMTGTSTIATQRGSCIAPKAA